MSDEKQAAWLTFFGKLITPLTIIILVLSFKSTVQERLSQASEVSVLGSSFKFDTQSFHGQLSARELYILMNANQNQNQRIKINVAGLEKKEKAAIYLLESKEMIRLEPAESKMSGDFYYIKLDPKGEELIEKLGLLD